MKKSCWYPLTFSLVNNFTNRRVLGQNKGLSTFREIPGWSIFLASSSFSSLSVPFSLHYSVDPAGEGEKLKQDKQQLINAQCPQGQGSIHWLILADGKSENNFNWLAVNMPTVHILSGGYREDAWNYYEFGGGCEWSANDERSRVCAAHMCQYYTFLSVSSCLPCHMLKELLRDC